MRKNKILYLLSSLILTSCSSLPNQSNNQPSDYAKLCDTSKGQLKKGDIAVVQDSQPYWISDTGIIYSEAEHARKAVNPLQSITGVITGSKEQSYKHIQITLLKDTASDRSSCVPTIIGSRSYNTILSQAPIGQKVLIQKASDPLTGSDFYNNSTHSGFVFAPILR